MADERDEIRARIDIVELVGQRVSLKRTGKTFKGLCPFHNDRNPSFTVDPATGRYRCWSCGEAGDCFTWVMKTQNVEFVDALKELAERAGIELKARGPAAPPGQREARRAAMNEALAFFREQLRKTPRARGYVEERGLDEEAVEAWELGYAPDVGEALAIHLKRQGHNLAECRELFLIDQDGRGGYFDKFRGRLMFPIRDERGELVAFGGRVLGDGLPKYINSSDTPLYRKSRVLYGFNRAKDRLSKERRAVLVEGYLDVIACHRAGETGAVASLGTSLSEEHAKLLKRWVDEVTILYDADDAGRKAAERAVGLLRAEDLRVRVALMPPGEDPDTLLRKAGPAAVRQAVERGLSPLSFAIGALEAKLKPSDEQFWTDLVDILASAPVDMESDLVLNRLSMEYPGTRDPVAARRRLDVMVRNRRRAIAQPAEERERPRNMPGARPPSTPMLGAEFQIFRAMQEPTFTAGAWMCCRQPMLFETQAALELASAVMEAFPASPPTGALATWLAKLPEEQQRQMEEMRLDLRGDRIDETAVADSIEWLKRRAAKRELLRRRRESLTIEERQEMHLINKALHPDARQQEADEDEDPFA